jgi:hypothetical protein
MENPKLAMKGGVVDGDVQVDVVPKGVSGAVDFG